jgi:hypothetical protein
MAASSRRTGPKIPLSEIKAEDLTDFQKEVAKNPYGKIARIGMHLTRAHG